jgi:hypothetical protein
MNSSKQDVVGERCIKNDAGELSITDEKMKPWVEHYARLLHVEFEWPSDLLLEAAPLEGPARPVILDEMTKITNSIQCHKSDRKNKSENWCTRTSEYIRGGIRCLGGVSIPC